MDPKPGTYRQTINPLENDFAEIAIGWLDELDSDLSETGDDFAEEIAHSDHNTVSEESAGNEGRNSDEDAEVGGENSGQDAEAGGSQRKRRPSTSSEQESSEEEQLVVKRYAYGKNRMKWALTAPTRNVRTPQHNILKLPTLRGAARLVESATPQEIWNTMFDSQMIAMVVQWTNVKLRKEASKYKDDKRTELRDTDAIEMKAFIGLLYYTAVFKSNHEDSSLLFATDGSGRDIFRAVLSKERFNMLLIHLRFDNPVDRNERKKTDPTAAVSEIFNNFIRNAQSMYSIGANACIDEMLVGFRGRCRFKMYMPNKPVKYGLKIMMLTDARTGYAYNAYIYSGKGSDGMPLTDSQKKNWNVPTQAVMRLTQPIYGSNRNVTADNWFSSLQVVDELKKQDLTYVGTLKKNKREVPLQFLGKKREEGTSIYGFTKDVTLLSHVPKKGKVVLLVSSMHHSMSDDPETGKPEIIAYYNTTKGGVDSLDEKCAIYGTSRRTQRWPMAIFFRILDMSAVNAYILNGCYKNNQDVSRSNFIKNLAMSLVKPYMEIRLRNPRINKEVKMLISRILDMPIPVLDEEIVLENRRYCFLCPSKLHRKTKYVCIHCQKPICLGCSRKICATCAELRE